jgi:hypothetical protein
MTLLPNKNLEQIDRLGRVTKKANQQRVNTPSNLLPKSSRFVCRIQQATHIVSNIQTTVVS